MTPRQLLVLALAAILSGCLVPDLPKPDDYSVGTDARNESWDGTYSWPDPIVTDDQGNVLSTVTDAASLAKTPVGIIRPSPGFGAEPALGVTAANNVFIVVGDETYRTSDLGGTWERVHNFVGFDFPETADRFSSHDPQLWVDRDTSRVFVDHMHPSVTCAYIAYSDDEGKTWSDTGRPVAVRPGFMDCGTPVIDHQKLMTAHWGPDAVGLPEGLRSYPNVVYLCVNKVINGNPAGTWCAVSLDGGDSFQYDRMAIPPSNPNPAVPTIPGVTDAECPGINGHPAAHPDGTVVVAAGALNCVQYMRVAVTSDNGLNWQMRMPPVPFVQVEVDPDITFTPDGTAYVVARGLPITEDVAKYIEENKYLPYSMEGVWMFRSKDKFQTWEGPFRVSPKTHVLNVFNAITSGDDVRVAIAYLGSTSEQEDPLNTTSSTAIEGTVWHLFVSSSFDADAEHPIFQTQQVNPVEDPVQIGCVWERGGGTPRSCRNLLDFIDMSVDKDGRYVVAFTDGCSARHGCSTDPEAAIGQSIDREVSLAALDHGEGLYADKGVLPSLGLSWELPKPHVGDEG